MIEGVHDVGRRIEPAAVRVHLENDRRSFVALGCFYSAPQECQERSCNLASQWHHSHIAFVNDLARVSGSCRGNEECSSNGNGHSERSEARLKNPVE